VAYQELYTTIGAQDAWKLMLEGASNVMKTMKQMTQSMGGIPAGAIVLAYDFV